MKVTFKSCCIINLLIILIYSGHCEASCLGIECADLNSDGSVDFRDFSILSQNWLKEQTGIHFINPWKKVVLDPNYASAWTIAGDLDGDNIPEIVSARAFNVDMPSSYDSYHYTCSVIAYRLDGSVLWKWGDPAVGVNKVGSDVACQIYDWDGDGKGEVIIATNGYILTLDGLTGVIKNQFAIPSGASDCIVFANLAGNPKPKELLVKSRYKQIWAYDQSGHQLWTCYMPGGTYTAHQPYPVDINGDGKDEIIAGFAMLNPDGSTRWTLSNNGVPFDGHLDCARLATSGSTPAEFRFVLTFCWGFRLALINGNGDLLWSVTGQHFESARVAKVLADMSEEQIVVDIDHSDIGQSPLAVYSMDGKLLSTINTLYSRYFLVTDWFGQGCSSICAGQKLSLMDGLMHTQAVFNFPNPAGWIICAKGDFNNDHRPDIMLYTSPNNEVYIYKNARGIPDANVPIGTELNFTFY